MKILIRLPNWLGDVVMSTAFTAAVRERYPNALIDVIIKKELGSIASLIPGINHIHLFSKKEYNGLTGAYAFGKTLRRHHYDVFFSLPSSISSATMGWATQSRKRVGFGSEGGFFLLTNVCRRPKNVHRATEYIALLEQFSGQTVNDSAVKLQAAETEKVNRRIIINFNSEATSRRMPVDKAVELLDAIAANFKDATLTLIGGPKDITYIDEVITASVNTAGIENYCGKTDLKGLASLLASGLVLLSTDSGPAHLANSIGLPVVALFGAGNELNTSPFNKHNLTVLRAGELSCEPCVRNTCKLYGVPRCMQLLSNNQIIQSLAKYINNA
ncbi:hypothetical protein DJ568_01545 [Mucilaginibacter hurinus]|uniref:Glycosyltransferase family 9 protein n=1 Tax=Mucilaginibacter hurinus TaxID=2201324 RepID=A0A367GTG6_9SPHI|nr:glycosyltransferase family 9 protein [Mucilaginibacter hurinus]RCH56570.1 hypothetical protein DJ568_01545 [Mucilaginibacter hurinus]